MLIWWLVVARNIDDDRIADQTVNCIEQDVLADGSSSKTRPWLASVPSVVLVRPS